MSTQKIIYLDNNHIGNVTCKKCGKMKAINVNGRDFSRGYKVICQRCGRNFYVRFEARQEYRKKTRLHGIFTTNDGLRGVAKIVDISLTGIGFMTSLEYPGIIKKMSIRLSFQLDNHKNTAVELGGKVINRRGKFVGIKITDIEEHIKNDIGFYLTPLLFSL